MTIQYLGGGSVGSFMPSTLAALVAAKAGIGLPVADLEAQLAGAISASANVSIQPPSLDLAAALEAAAQLPGVQVDVTAMATLAVQLKAEIGALQLALGLVLKVMDPFGATGLFAWELQGPIGQMAGELGGQINGGAPGIHNPDQQGTAIVLLAADNGAAAALQALFAG